MTQTEIDRLKKEFYKRQGYNFDIEFAESVGEAQCLRNEEIRCDWQWILDNLLNRTNDE